MRDGPAVPAAPKTNPYVFYDEGEILGAPGLSAICCRDCRRFTLGRVPVCSHCLSRDVEAMAAGQNGHLVEHAVVHHPADGFEAPYAVALVRTAEGMTLFAPFEGRIDGLAPGEPLRFVTVPRASGAIGFAYARREPGS